MARKSVKEFFVKNNGDSVDVFIQTENRKPHKYRITADERHNNIDEIAEHLQKGLDKAVQDFERIEITDYQERQYVHIVLPIELASHQYTARKIK